MKKFIFALVFWGIAAWAFSFESSISLGFEFDNSFDNNNYIGSPGLDLSLYQLWGNIGYYLNFTLSFPDKIITDVNINDYDYLLQLSTIIGPAFRYGINEKMNLLFAIGYSSTQTYSNYNQNISGGNSENHSFFGYSLGVGSNVGIRYDLNQLININLGSNFVYHFADYIKTDDISKWKNNYNMIGIRPYIQIGITFR